VSANVQRREFITLLGGAAVVWPPAARAQQAGRIARVGVLGPDLNNSVSGPGYQVFLSELRKLGFTEGQNLVVEYRRTDEGPQLLTRRASSTIIRLGQTTSQACRRRLRPP
jgi:putative tryptophan/tyrosine transport system substrate-binding protein